MDLESAGRTRRDSAPTELFGDLSTGGGWVYPPGEPRWPIPAKELVLVVDQILSHGKADGLQARGTATRLGRSCTRYEGIVDVTEDGEHFQNVVVRAIDAPFVLFEEIRNASNSELSYVRELLSIQEGMVSDADMTPPP